MDPNPKFEVRITEYASERTGESMRFVQEAEGCDDLFLSLEDKGIQTDDVTVVNIVGASETDQAINEAIRALDSNDVLDIIFGVSRSRLNGAPEPDVYLIASVMSGQLIEFQVSDGPPGNRGTSFDCYVYSEAKKIFDRVVEVGWREANRTPVN